MGKYIGCYQEHFTIEILETFAKAQQRWLFTRFELHNSAHWKLSRIRNPTVAEVKHRPL